LLGDATAEIFYQRRHIGLVMQSDGCAEHGINGQESGPKPRLRQRR
jgi:hypothetical protein